MTSKGALISNLVAMPIAARAASLRIFVLLRSRCFRDGVGNCADAAKTRPGGGLLAGRRLQDRASDQDLE